MSGPAEGVGTSAEPGAGSVREGWSAASDAGPGVGAATASDAGSFLTDSSTGSILTDGYCKEGRQNW